MRVIYLKYEIAQTRNLLRRVELTVHGDIPGIGFQDMHLEFYLLPGLLVGSLLCMIVFRTSLNHQNGEPNCKMLHTLPTLSDRAMQEPSKHLAIHVYKVGLLN